MHARLASVMGAVKARKGQEKVPGTLSASELEQFTPDAGWRPKIVAEISPPIC
jgi:hypothetical protein